MSYVNRVQVFKQEDYSRGGDTTQDDGVPAPIKAQEDAIESAGLILQDISNRDERVTITREGANLTFMDVSNPLPTTLSSLKQGLRNVVEDLTPELGGDLDTLGHKVLGAKLITNQSIREVPSTSVSVAVDWNLAQRQILRLSQAKHVLSFVAPVGPATLTLFILQDSVGNRGIQWPANVVAPRGKLSISKGANSLSLVALTYINTGTPMYVAMSSNGFLPAGES